MMNRDTTTLIHTHEDFPAVHETVIDGVQTFWVDAGAPFVATLIFRVGIADETLVTRGITHLVEHLALSGIRDVAHPFNGSVGIDQSTFWAAGSETDVLAFVTRLIDQLTTLPLDRLELEAGVLIAEGMQRQRSTLARLLTHRFGPHGPGLMTFAEYGLRRLDGETVQRWARDHFTADNAVLVLTGPPPESLQLALPRGSRRPLALPPDRYSFDVAGRTRVSTQSGGFAVGAFGRRSTPLVMAGQIVAARAQEQLRHELGRVYSVGHEYIRLTAEEAYLYWGADSAPDHTAEVTQAFGAVLNEMTATGPTQVEIEHQIAMAEQMFAFDQAAVAREVAHRTAGAKLLGHPVHRFADVLDEMHAATPHEIAGALDEATQCAMAIATDELDIGFADPARHGDQPVRGRATRIKRNGEVRRFVVAPDALGSVTGDDWLTLQFDELELVEQHPGGGRLLVDHRGAWIAVMPDSRRERRVIAEIDARVPAHVVIPAARSG